MIKIYAHRGLSKIYPENSLDAIKEATKYDYIYGIEFDVRMTKDKKFVVTHNADINLVSNGTGLVCNMTLEELYKYDFSNNAFEIKKEYLKSFFRKDGRIYRKQIKSLNNKSSKICTLETVLTMIKNKKLLIEIKKDNDECFDLDKFYRIIKKYNTNNIMIHSFNKDVIEYLRKKNSNLNLGIIVGIHNIEKKLEMETNFISIEYSRISKKILKKQIELNKEINLWTINNYKEIKRIKNKLGELFSKVNIITDNPNIIYKYLKIDE